MRVAVGTKRRHRRSRPRRHVRGPRSEGIAFEAVGVVGGSDEVEATLDTGERVGDTWEVRVCPPEFRGDGLNHAGVLRIEDDDVRFVTNECDFVAVDRVETYEWDPEESRCES